jgi:DNA-directed RNA polymerase subunit M/transcription elongation factor TFIIS
MKTKEIVKKCPKCKNNLYVEDNRCDTDRGTMGCEFLACEKCDYTGDLEDEVITKDNVEKYMMDAIRTYKEKNLMNDFFFWRINLPLLKNAQELATLKEVLGVVREFELKGIYWDAMDLRKRIEAKIKEVEG